MESSKKRQIESDQVKAKLRKKPMYEDFGGMQMHYGLLDKQNKSFVLSNERLLVLKINRSIGYARNIPKETFLPFYQEANIPKLKREIELTKIQNVFAPDKVLTIEFLPEVKEPKWQFTCDSKPIANDWKDLILNAVNAYKLNTSNKPFQVTVPDQSQNMQPETNNQQWQQGMQQNNPQWQQGMQPQQNFNNSLPFNPNQPQQGQQGYPNSEQYYSSVNSSAKRGLQPIPEQHQDNETEQGNRNSGHPLGKEEPPRIPGVL